MWLVQGQFEQMPIKRWAGHFSTHFSISKNCSTRELVWRSNCRSHLGQQDGYWENSRPVFLLSYKDLRAGGFRNPPLDFIYSLLQPFLSKLLAWWRSLFLFYGRAVQRTCFLLHVKWMYLLQVPLGEKMAPHQTFINIVCGGSIFEKIDRSAALLRPPQETFQIHLQHWPTCSWGLLDGPPRVLLSHRRQNSALVGRT